MNSCICLGNSGECSDDNCGTLFLMPAESFSLIFSPHWKERFLPFPDKTRDVEFMVEMPLPRSSPPGHIQFFTVKHLQSLTLNLFPACVTALAFTALRLPKSQLERDELGGGAGGIYSSCAT